MRDRIEVSGDFGEKPKLEIDSPLKLKESTSWSEETGAADRSGPTPRRSSQPTLADGRTGKTAISTFDKGQRALEVKLGEQVFPSLVQALGGKPAKSRVVVASTSDDAYGEQGCAADRHQGRRPGRTVADVISTDPTSVLDEPTGATRAAPAKAPVLKEKDGLPVGFDFAKARKVKKLTVIPLREGTGPVVEEPGPDRGRLPRAGLGRQAALRGDLQQGAGAVLHRAGKRDQGLGQRPGRPEGRCPRS